MFIKVAEIDRSLREKIYDIAWEVGFEYDRTRIVSKNIKRGRKQLIYLCKMTNQGKINVVKLHQSLSAWKGHLKHGDTYLLRQQLPVCLTGY